MFLWLSVLLVIARYWNVQLHQISPICFKGYININTTCARTQGFSVYITLLLNLVTTWKWSEDNSKRDATFWLFIPQRSIRFGTFRLSVDHYVGSSVEIVSNSSFVWTPFGMLSIKISTINETFSKRFEVFLRVNFFNRRYIACVA